MYMIKIGASYLTPTGDLSASQADALKLDIKPALTPCTILGDTADIKIRAVRLTPKGGRVAGPDPRD